MTIGFFQVEDWEEAEIRAAFPGEELRLHEKKCTEVAPKEREDIEIAAIFVHTKFDDALFEQFPKLKCLATRSTGYDHIDIAAAKRRGVTVLYVPGYGDNTVAEYAFGLILNLSRKIYQGIDRVKETGMFRNDDLRGVDVRGKTLGVIGTGRIGREAVKIAKGFGMNVVAHDPYPDSALAKRMGFAYAGLDELLSSSDFITLHCPYNEHTHHLIHKGNIRMVKRGAYLVNTARGAIVETEAIVMALQEGILGGAGLDVLEEENESRDEMLFLSSGHPSESELKVLLRNHELVRMPNVLITPHNAFNSKETLQRILETTIRNIRSFMDGKPENVVK